MLDKGDEEEEEDEVDIVLDKDNHVHKKNSINAPQ